jgi:iron uptake system EfeUOB component EfeO/EfeM
MQENVEGIEAVYKLTFEKALEAKDDKLADQIDEQIDKVEDLVDVKDLKDLDQTKLNDQAEQLAVMLQDAASPLGLEKPTLGD